mmetsp:Transcript_68806/g.185404  ORF Transcript_68806/g.185404 Transcript_68806/m.185404 type:complete len:119 (-) Transcript_68806:124-480(-)
MGFSDKELALKSKRLVRSTKVVLDLSLTVVATCLGVALLYGVAFSAQADIIGAARLTSFLVKALVPPRRRAGACGVPQSLRTSLRCCRRLADGSAELTPFGQAGAQLRRWGFPIKNLR